MISLRKLVIGIALLPVIAASAFMSAVLFSSLSTSYWPRVSLITLAVGLEGIKIVLLFGAFSKHGERKKVISVVTGMLVISSIFASGVEIYSNMDVATGLTSVNYNSRSTTIIFPGFVLG